jgi:hypothetical protein
MLGEILRKMTDVENKNDSDSIKKDFEKFFKEYIKDNEDYKTKVSRNQRTGPWLGVVNKKIKDKGNSKDDGFTCDFHIILSLNKSKFKGKIALALHTTLNEKKHCEQNEKIRNELKSLYNNIETLDQIETLDIKGSGFEYWNPKYFFIKCYDADKIHDEKIIEDLKYLECIYNKLILEYIKIKDSI